MDCLPTLRGVACWAGGDTRASIASRSVYTHEGLTMLVFLFELLFSFAIAAGPGVGNSAVPAAAAAVPSVAQDAVGTVNGEPILRSDYFNRMEFMSGVGTVLNGRFVQSPPAFLAIERLINDRLVLQLAKSKGVSPTAGEIENSLKEHLSREGDRIKILSDFGVPQSELKALVAVELAQFKLATMGVTVTDQQVTEYYNTNKAYFTTPAKVKLKVIVVKSVTDRDKVDIALKTRPFSDVAREMSTDLTKFDGGDLPEVDVGRLPQNTLNEVSRTAEGQMTAWIESEGAFLKYLVEKKEAAKQLPLDPQLRESIRKQLMVSIGQTKNDLKKMMDELRKSAKVQLSSPGLQKLWDAYIKDYLLQSGGG
ncbi:MAG: hypothetical protein D8M53_11740 [Armatimonadetes bacterium]|nr:hypothetical protein [Armatimonadota bacterium]